MFPKVPRSWCFAAALACLFSLALLAVPAAVNAQEATPSQTEQDVQIISQTVTSSGVNTIVRVNTSQDAFLSSRNPNVNYGGDQYLRLGWQSGIYDAVRMMLQFDLNSIPANATVNSARLYIYQTESIPGNDISMGFRAQFVRSPWSEFGVTWNNANYLGGTALPLENVSSANGWKSADVTSLIHTWQSGSQPNHGLILTGDEVPSDNRARVFYSRQSSLGAYIDVDYSVQCDNIPPQSSVTGLPAYSPGLFLVEWNGQDFAPSGCDPSGIAYYDVYYRINGGSWVHWKDQTQATSNHFKNYASNGDHVELTARAADRAGNVEAQGNAQTTTVIDTLPPTTSMTPLPEFTPTSFFTVNWAGSDNLSGVGSYDLQWRINGGNWQILIEGTQQTSFQITGAQSDNTYDFRVRATDFVGNVQDFPEVPQASTKVRTYPIAHVLPFQPDIIKPTNPISDSFPVNWTTAFAPGTQVVSFQIFYRYKGGPWTIWQTFPGTQFSARFEFANLGLGDGLYEFEAIATNNLGQVQPKTGIAQDSVIVDLADQIHPAGYFPIFYAQAP